MLVALRCEDRKPVKAADAGPGFFVCPQCDKPVRLTYGGKFTRHFVHTSSPPCAFDFGESETHRRIKTEIFEALHIEPDVTALALEVALGTVRPDVLVQIRGQKVAIEVQISSLSLETIAYRTAEYAEKGIYVLWLLEWTPALMENRYCPRPFERWLHATYYGRVYFWRRGLTVLPFHFREHRTDVPERRWSDESGRRHKAFGYRRTSKRYRTPICGRPLHIVRDFAGRTRPKWNNRHLDIPDARLFMDKYEGFMPE
jgi:competence protein CoiA